MTPFLLAACPEYQRLKEDRTPRDRVYGLLKEEFNIDVYQLFPHMTRWDLHVLPWFAFDGLPMPEPGTSWVEGGRVTYNGWALLCEAMDTIFAKGLGTLEAFCSAFGWRDPLEMSKRYLAVCCEEENPQETLNGQKIQQDLLLKTPRMESPDKQSGDNNWNVVPTHCTPSPTSCVCPNHKKQRLF